MSEFDRHPGGRPPHSHLPPDPALRVMALETLLVRKGLIDPSALDEIADHYANRVGPRNGAIVVAKSWLDPSFRESLLRDATGTVSSLGFTGRQGEHIVAVENTPDIHNIVVCTLCSCYPWTLLGLPPAWYKSDAYRSRTIREPRSVLAEFGVNLLQSQKVRVWDSTAEVRYLVVPMRPDGTEGMTEDQLAGIIARDCMIGTALPRLPEPGQ
ncbi:MAG: nitrile hydratase subunit alpha [Rhodobacteraceae bacterium]|nr:nitrile hydratase subunit alpha [Paracoccaceae bacterium]